MALRYVATAQPNGRLLDPGGLLTGTVTTAPVTSPALTAPVVTLVYNDETTSGGTLNEIDVIMALKSMLAFFESGADNAAGAEFNV